MRDLSLPIRSPYHEFILSHPQQAKRIDSLLESGRRLLEAGQNDEARRLFLQALSVYPHVVPALNNLALISLREGDIGRSIDVVHQVLECDPHDAVAHSLAAQCYYYRESEPLINAHVDACLAAYLQLVEQGDPVDPTYPDRAFPFVFQALLMAEDAAGIIRLYQAVPSRQWTALELTWVGIASFNRGQINEAHLIWRRAAKATRYEAASVYAGLAQRVLSEDMLPFTLDYELMAAEDEDFGTYPPSSLTIARAVNEMFRRPSQEAQALVAQLIDYEMPAQDYFLRRLLQNEKVAPGVRMAAAIQLVWLGDTEPLAEKLFSQFDANALTPEDQPAYYLLGATLAQFSDAPDSPAVRHLVEAGCKAIKGGGVLWITQCLKGFFDDAADGPNVGGDFEFEFSDPVDWDESALFPPFMSAHLDQPKDASDTKAPGGSPRKLRGKRGGRSSDPKP